MGDRSLPEQRPGDLIVIQYQEPIPHERGSVMRIRYVRISRFNNYGQLKSYLRRKCGGGRRRFPGGADYPVITYTKYNDPYNDMNNVERQLRTEPWDVFAASVYHILIKRVQA